MSNNLDVKAVFVCTKKDQGTIYYNWSTNFSSGLLLVSDATLPPDAPPSLDLKLMKCCQQWKFLFLSWALDLADELLST